MKKLQYCVYVLLSQKDNQFYIGYTTNLHERLTSHISGNSKATEPRRPFTLIFCEYYLSKHDATRREKYFKTTVGKKVLRLMLQDSLKKAHQQSYIEIGHDEVGDSRYSIRKMMKIKR